MEIADHLSQFCQSLTVHMGKSAESFAIPPVHLRVKLHMIFPIHQSLAYQAWLRRPHLPLVH